MWIRRERVCIDRVNHYWPTRCVADEDLSDGDTVQMTSCARYPEYGLVRHFRLRSMQLTMTFANVRFSQVAVDQSPRLASYTLQLRVEPDRSAERDIAAPCTHKNRCA